MTFATLQARPRKLGELLDGFADVGELADLLVDNVESDSRRVTEGSLYMACRSFTSARHGLNYTDQALSQGASAIAYEPVPDLNLPEASVPLIPVPGLSHAAGEIAARLYDNPSRQLYLIGITGTDGKTSCAHILAQAIEYLGGRCGLLGTLGFGFLDDLKAPTHTTPDAVNLQRWIAYLRNEGADAVAMEVSSHALDQGRTNALEFDTAVLTNIGRDHLDYHGSVQAYVEAKRRLFESKGLAVVVLNRDDPQGRRWLKEMPEDVRPIAYGLGEWRQTRHACFVNGEVETHSQGLSLKISSHAGKAVLNSHLLGRFNAYNLLAALAVLLEKGYGLDDVLKALSQVRPVPGRMQAMGGGDQPLVVIDYAHTPQAIRAALSALRAHCENQLWCVFGCGGDRDTGKRPLMAQAAHEIADHIVITDDNPRTESPGQIVADILAGLPSADRNQVIHDRREAIAFALSQARPGDVVLVAGKGHEEYQIVGDQRLPFRDQTVVAQCLDMNQGAAHG